MNTTCANCSVPTEEHTAKDLEFCQSAPVAKEAAMTTIVRTQIIGTNTVVFSAWESYANHSAIRHNGPDRVKLGELSSRQLPEVLRHLDGETRYQAVMGFIDALQVMAQVAILEANPWLAQAQMAGEYVRIDGSRIETTTEVEAQFAPQAIQAYADAVAACTGAPVTVRSERRLADGSLVVDAEATSWSPTTCPVCHQPAGASDMGYQEVGPNGQDRYGVMHRACTPWNQ